MPSTHPYTTVQCHDSLHLRHLSMNWSNSKKWPSEISATCTPFFRALTVSWGLDTSESSSSCLPSAVRYSRSASSSSSVNSAAGELRMPQLSVSSKYGNPSGIFCANMRVFYFILPVGKPLEVINCFRPKSYFQQPFRVTDSTHPWPPLYYYAIRFPGFTDTKKGLLLARIHDAAERAVRIVMREYHGDYLAVWLQWWGGFLGDTLYGYFDGQEQNPAYSRTMRPYNARFFDFRYHSTWWTKQLPNQSCNNCFIN